MKRKITYITYALCTAFMILTSCNSAKIVQKTSEKQGYVPSDKALYVTILKQDSILFEAFNTKNLMGLKSYFTDKLEVYQDNTGLRNYDQTIGAFEGLLKWIIL
jgi:hypothetical protein